MSPIEYDLSSPCSCIDVSMELLRRTWWTVVHSQQKSLAVNICVLPLRGSWSYRAIDWTVSVVGAFSVAGPSTWNSLPDSLRDPELSFDTFKRQLKTYIFAKYWWQNVLSALEIFLSMRYINLHFTYLLTYCVPKQTLTVLFIYLYGGSNFWLFIGNTSHCKHRAWTTIQFVIFLESVWIYTKF